MKIENVKGGNNYLPKEQVIRNYINDVLIETFKEYGYKPVETPILTYYDILSDKYDENNDLLNEIYKLTDQGNRKLGLRYDLTVPFAKLIALSKNSIKLPFKRYEIAKVFRDGPVKLGRDREFTQCDVDVVGIKGSMIEAELISLYVSAFNKLNIDILIKYNSRNLMRGLIKSCGISDNLVSKVITIVDKFDKLSKKELNDLFISIGLNKNNIEELLNYFNCNIEQLNKLNIDNEEFSIGLKEINELNMYINELKLNDYVKFSPTLARGQDYYTGNVFEVYEKNNKISCSIGGGGRYDNMITEFINDGNIYPAVGISFGLTSIYELLKDKDIVNNDYIYIIPLDTNIESLKLATFLRNLGYSVDVEMSNRKLKKSLEFANKENIRYVIILGSEEVENKEFKIRDMKLGKEFYIKNIDELQKVFD